MMSVVAPTRLDSSRAALKPAKPAPTITTRCRIREFTIVTSFR